MKFVRALLLGFVAVATGFAAISAQAGGTIETFTVNSIADTETPGTLRQAILDANASTANQADIEIDLPDGSEILLTSDLPTLSHPDVKVANIHPSRQIIVDGDQSYRVFEQTGLDPVLFVVDLEIREGRLNASGASDGGACLFTQGSAILQSVRFVGCRAFNGSGGAVHVRKTLLVADSSFTGNRLFQNGTDTYRGGAIYCTGTYCSITNSSFTDNRVDTQLIGQTERGGGAASLSADEITVQNSTFESNAGPGRGGALYLGPTQAGSSIQIKDSLFRANDGGEGGAVYVWGNNMDQSLLLERNSFERNTVTSIGPAVVTIMVPQVTLNSNVFYMQKSNNTSTDWGTVYVFGNSTRSSSVSLDFNTFVGEDANSVLFEANEGASADDVVVTRMHANVFDQRAPAAPACREEYAQLVPESGQFNVVSDDSCTGTIEADSVINVDPLLNDAISQTDRTLVYPKEASPAIDIVTSESLVVCSGQNDLDGVGRPLDGDDDGIARCDAGALERNVELFQDRFES